MEQKKFCLNCGKELNVKYNKFCNQSCAATYNNKNRKLTTKGKKKLVKCIKCGENFWASIHISTKKCKCEKCKTHNRPHAKDKNNLNSILDISKRTSVLILKRMNMGCSICGWNESTCDIHHIIPRKDGGTNDMNNLIYICPNCHRICHTTNRYTEEFLQEKSLQNLAKNWKDYYHPSN